MLNSPEIRNAIIGAFPQLKNDPCFEIIDGSTPNYNCIAWAANVKDKWFSSLPHDKRPYKFEGVVYNWPHHAADEFSIAALEHIFTNYGYIKCPDSSFIPGYKKVAFYVKDGEATHAARQLTFDKHQGLWTSKLGQGPCIIHSVPEGVSGDAYGDPVFFMKKTMN